MQKDKMFKKESLFKKDKKNKIERREREESEKDISKVKNNNIIEKRKVSSEIMVIYPVDPSKF